MVDFPAYFPYFKNKGFTIFLWATICGMEETDERVEEQCVDL